MNFANVGNVAYVLYKESTMSTGALLLASSPKIVLELLLEELLCSVSTMGCSPSRSELSTSSIGSQYRPSTV